MWWSQTFGTRLRILPAQPDSRVNLGTRSARPAHSSITDSSRQRRSHLHREPSGTSLAVWRPRVKFDLGNVVVLVHDPLIVDRESWPALLPRRRARLDPPVEHERFHGFDYEPWQLQCVVP